MRWKPSVFARQDATLIGDELPQKVHILEIERIDGEISLWLWPRCSNLRAASSSIL